MEDDADAGRGLPDDLVRLIFEQTAIPFVLIDRAGTIVHAGASIALVVGWKPHEIIGRNMVEFVDPADAELTLVALEEIDTIDRMASSVPVVFPLRRPDGSWRHVEVAAMPLAGSHGLIALRLRSWEAERHMSDFVRAMLGDGPLDHDLEALTRSLAASLEGVGASVHHGFDGTAFHGVAGSWPGAASLPVDAEPWTTAFRGDGVQVVEARDPALRDIGARIGWLVPVRPASGLPPAVLSLWRAIDDGPFLGHRRAFVQAADFVELAVVRSAEHERLSHLARHDPLTGVANRTTFRDVLAAALARGERDLAVGFCDLDDFKRVNDSHGHGRGDEVLVEMAGRLREGLRGGDELARMGGDEFTILWRNIPDERAAEVVAARVVAAGDTAITVGGHEAVVGVSVGVSLVHEGATADSLLAAADAALYEAKQAGGRRAVIRRSLR